MDVKMTSNHIKIKIKRPNSSQEPQAPTQAPNQDLKDMDVLQNQKQSDYCIFKLSWVWSWVLYLSQCKYNMVMKSQKITSSGDTTRGLDSKPCHDLN